MSSVIRLIIFGLGLLSAIATAQFPKRGISFNEDIAISGFGGGEVFWQFNWDSDTGLGQQYTEYTPMLWSDQPVHTDGWNGHVAKWMNQGNLPTTHLIGFNECDLASQALMSPQEAAESYRTWITPYAGQGATLVGPSVTNGASGMPWMQTFWPLCADCGIEFANFHWYGQNGDFAIFQSYVTEACNLVHPTKIWLSEFESYPVVPTNPGEATQSEFMAQALPWLDDNPCVDRYAWFGSADPDKNLLIGNGPQLSALGNQYVTEPFDFVKFVE